mmetsp:Transcript_87825/g.272978  ORF Transcript_87825/g.272978 Transcript_87825/m.272978 type:complete len:403 (-) Transcript_87825:723-1931(-)|eukprot:CAMPEP_0204532748 /NCGR_PEP_ID=MMETSP0661-20131031/11893_1 /ASSEMBLY_ACC=CAM_ASM_000606 /TAXON_ID=109239 /ORGANISM="Alexandrium margalefi, Strain AMGDE01CS-322" /LENGTH=402 /DNA_ID=CAMNT_0051539015 /DNA_START=70 /DNA_END=1278 /DNA_ORIENTATION=-
MASDSAVFTTILIICQVAFVAYFQIAGLGYGTGDKMDFSPAFYVMFIDVSVMIFFGFGFLMTFLRRYGYSAVGLCVITSCLTIQFSLVMQGLLKDQLPQGGYMNLFTLINGLFCAGAVMISMGASLGKLSASQLIVMALCETVLYWAAFYVYMMKIGAHDAAGGITLHAFGAYFGLAVAFVFSNPTTLEHEDNKSIYSSDLFSLAGSLFLWILWPSFCAAVAEPGAPQFYAVTNTFISLVGSTMGFAIISRLLHGGSFNVVEMQNATLAGGVVMGVPADLSISPAGAMTIGLIAGVVSTLGFARLDLGELLGLGDSCGVHNLHGMPGLLSGLAGLFLANPVKQGLGMVCTLGMAIAGGLLTAAIMRLLPSVKDSEAFNDVAMWEVPDDYQLDGRGAEKLSEA